MKTICKTITLLLCLAMAHNLWATDGGWPKTINFDNGKIALYQPQPEALNGNKLSSVMAISVTTNGKDPVFGAVWSNATLDIDRDHRTATIEEFTITSVKFPDVKDSSKINELKKLLQEQILKSGITVSMDRITASLADQQPNSSTSLSNKPPKIIYETTPTLLVLIDGDPKEQTDKNLGLQRVVNTPFVMVVGADKKYYLYVSDKWFGATAATATDWSYTQNPPKDVAAITQKIADADKNAGDTTKAASDVLPEIVVSTVPAELIQSNGKADMKAITGTSLLYVSNTEDNIFMNITDQHYYVLLSGRWYKSVSLTSNEWTYVPGDKLPADFAKIPEGSPKDIVLANVPGTEAAREAVTDAQMPQTAKVDRKTATTTVVYDGKPQFKKIAGTDLEYAVNTSSTVLKDGKDYYVVDNGVWFTSTSAEGPWKVATERPADVDKIPADNPTYNVKYVYVYDVTPDYVWMGYTPGYMGCYVYGGVVVYGTGFYYAPWYGTVYYPRPVTWGFSMHYNPWTGWSMGIGVNVGCFHFGFGYNFSYGYGFAGGWFGPPVFFPPYHYPYSHFYGPVRPVVVAPHNNIVINNYNHINVNHVNRNVYNQRTGVTTNPRNLSGVTRVNPPADRVNNLGGATRRENNMQVGRDGNLYQRGENGQWQQRENNNWKPARQNESRDLSNTQQMRSRGEQRTTNFENRSGFSQQRSVPQRSGGRRR